MISGDWISGVQCPNAKDSGCGETLVWIEYGVSNSPFSDYGAECDWCSHQIAPDELEDYLQGDTTDV